MKCQVLFSGKNKKKKTKKKNPTNLSFAELAQRLEKLIWVHLSESIFSDVAAYVFYSSK